MISIVIRLQQKYIGFVGKTNSMVNGGYILMVLYPNMVLYTNMVIYTNMVLYLNMVLYPNLVFPAKCSTMLFTEMFDLHFRHLTHSAPLEGVCFPLLLQLGPVLERLQPQSQMSGGHVSQPER